MSQAPQFPDHSDDPTLRWGLSQAQGYFELGMLDKSEKELNRLGKEHQDNPLVMTLRVRVLLARKFWPRVIETAHHAVRLYPTLPEFYVHGAAAYDMIGEREMGREFWQSAPEVVRSSGVLHLHMARFEAGLGNVESAREHLHNALILEPGLRALAGKDPRLADMLHEHSNN